MITSISYSHAAFGEPEALILQARKELAEIDYDSMVGTGLSGALIIPILARALNKPFAIIRKANESCHAYKTFEGTIGDRWLFVDDFICSGRTLETVSAAVRLATMQPVYDDEGTHTGFDCPSKFVGAYCYDTEFKYAGDLQGVFSNPRNAGMKQLPMLI